MLEKDVNEPIEAVFISDLHLHPDEIKICERFNTFLAWAALNTKKLYILGDFFHVWAGDDDLEPWSLDIAKSLRALKEQGVEVYFMAGNRDFLLGSKFANLAGFTLLKEPFVVNLNERVLLAHGDSYCINDRAHFWFRKLTRNKLFPRLFLTLPLAFRKKIVGKVREHSQTKPYKSFEQLDIVPAIMLKEMDRKNANILIHGHTHKPALRNYDYNNKKYSEYVLSDWEESPYVLCYYKTKGFFLKQVL